MKNEIIIFENQKVKLEVNMKDEIVIENLIYEVRGKQVMLDSEISETKCHELFIKKGMINSE